MQTTRFLNLTCIELRNEALSLLISQSAGPRVISLRLHHGPNLLAELPDLTALCPGSGLFHFYGGHRLWIAPEYPPLTCLPDDDPVEITEIEHGLLAVQPPAGGVQKTLRVTLPPGAARVIVEHTLTNRGDAPLTCAAWAITQLAPGGTAILPHSTGDADPFGVLPNRQINLWPYADVNDPHMQWGNAYTLVRAAFTGGRFKMGFPNPRGWLAYWQAGTLFVKRAVFDPQAAYLDFGSSSECYCDPRFLELETLSGVRMLPAGESLSHVEGWEIYGEVAPPVDESAAGRIADQLGLG